tara:strand:+ start:109 stop:924 length:816 start_codon:yes stop_codon:yes gene_type:complete
MEEVNTTGNVIPGGVGDQGPNNSFNDEVSNNDGGGGSPQSNAQNIAKTMLNNEINNLKTPSVSGITYKGNFKNSSIDTATRMFGNVENPVPSPSQFNKGFESLPQTVQDQIDPAGESDKAVAKFIQSAEIKPAAKKSTLTFTPKAPSTRKIDPDVKAAKKEIRKGGNVSGGGNVLDDFGHKYGYKSDKAKELDNSRLVTRKRRQENNSAKKNRKIDVKKFAEETAAAPKQYGGTYKEGKKKARQLNKEDRQKVRSENRADAKRTKKNRKSL